MSYVVLFTPKLTKSDEQYHTLNDTLYQALIKQQGYSGQQSFRDKKGLDVLYSIGKN